ncbi:PEP-utilizing enzyme [Nanoarchaeota archaeon]
MKAKDIIKKHGLDSTSWTFKGFHGLPFTFYYIGNGPLHWCSDYYGDQCKKSMFFCKDDYIRWYWPDEDMRRLRKLLVENVNKDPDYLKKMRSYWEARLAEFEEVLQNLESTDFNKASDKELFELFDDFLVKFERQFTIVMVLQDAYSMYSAEFLEPYFEKILSKHRKLSRFTEYYTTLMSPVENSFIADEKKSRLQILKEMKAGHDVNDLLKQHQSKYYWIRNNYAKQPVLDVKFFEEDIKSMKFDPDKELKRMDKEHEAIKKEKQRMIEELDLDKEAVNYIRITELFSFMQDERKKYVLMANHHERRFMKELAKRRSIPKKHIEYTVYPETKDNLDPDVLKERVDEGCVCIQDNEGFYIYEGKEVEKMHEKLFGKQDEEVHELKGTAASKGIARGPVKIVQKTHDLVNFMEGDILVSSMTRPEMIMAMKKAAAIVTDEGGITSHAAIVSRELGIPCIIGTKSATKAFKNGDFVEVNAEESVIRKIPHS